MQAKEALFCEFERSASVAQACRSSKEEDEESFQASASGSSLEKGSH